MNLLKTVLVLVALAIGMMAGSTASADGYYRSGGHDRSGYYGGHYDGHFRGGHFRSGLDVVIGGPFWGQSWYYPTPYYYPDYYPYYYPPAVAMPSSPPVYIERDEPAESSAPSGLWYYCPEAKAYYPYVRECPGGWQTVQPQPPSGQRR